MKRLCFIVTLIILSLVLSILAVADAPWYVVPVKVTYIDETFELGFLPLYGNEIKGFLSDDKKVRYIAVFGMGASSNEKMKMQSLDYKFDVIQVQSDGSVFISFGNQKVLIRKVDYFLSENGMVFCNKIGISKKGFEWDPKAIPMKRLKSIQRIGEVTFVDAGSD